MTTTPHNRRPVTGPPDLPAVHAAMALQRWQAAYSAAHGCRATAALIEQRKADALAALTAEWRKTR